MGNVRAERWSAMRLISPTDSMFLLTESREHPMHVGGLQLFKPTGRTAVRTKVLWGGAETEVCRWTLIGRRRTVGGTVAAAAGTSSCPPLKFGGREAFWVESVKLRTQR